MNKIEIRWFEGKHALAEMATPLMAADLCPAPMLAMDPEYLAAGFEGDHPVAMVAWDGDRPVAYLAFSLRRSVLKPSLGPVRLGVFPYRQLRLYAYQGPADEAAAILDQCFAEITRQYRRSSHAMVVAELPVDNPLAEYLQRVATEHSRPSVLRRIQINVRSSYRLSISGTFESYLQSRFKSKTRYNLRRMLRVLDEAAEDRVTVQVFSKPADVERFLPDADRVARRSYQWRRGFDAVSDTPATRQRLTRLAQRCQWRGYLLYLGSEPIAYCNGTVYRRKYNYDAVGYDDRYAQFSPGTVLLYRILEDLFAAEVAEELDFGAGEAEYKRMFATANPTVLYANIYRPGLYPSLLYGINAGLPHLSSLLKSAISQFHRRPSSAKSRSEVGRGA